MSVDFSVFEDCHVVGVHSVDLRERTQRVMNEWAQGLLDTRRTDLFRAADEQAAPRELRAGEFVPTDLGV